MQNIIFYLPATDINRIAKKERGKRELILLLLYGNKKLKFSLMVDPQNRDLLLYLTVHVKHHYFLIYLVL